MISSSNGSCGNDRKRSASHIRKASMPPRDMPAIAPIITPTVAATSMAHSPTAREMRPPYIRRASTSWPRSSVPSGCAQDGPSSLAAKSISLIGTRQTSGPSSTVSTSANRMTALAMAGLWRRNRRQASMAGENRTCLAGLATTAAPACGSAVRDTGVEPAIDDVGDEVEDDDEAGQHEGDGHDHGRVVGQHGRDQERADAGHAEDLLGDDGAAEYDGQLQRDQGHHRNERRAHHVPDDDRALADALGAGGRDIVEPDDVEHGGPHVAHQRRALEQAEHRHRHDRLLELL